MRYAWVIVLACFFCACGKTERGGFSDGVFRGFRDGQRPSREQRRNVPERVQVRPPVAALCSFTRTSFASEYRPLHEGINYYFSRLSARPRSWRNAGADRPVRRVELEAYEFGFAPRCVRVRKGEQLIIYVTSRDIPHHITIDDYGVSAPVRRGALRAIRFQADRAGAFAIRCAACCDHGHADMAATLIVE